MPSGNRSRSQRVLLALMPWWAAAMEAESREWRSTCACGHTFSIWDVGGVRFKAAGQPTNLLSCPACGDVAARVLERHRDA